MVHIGGYGFNVYTQLLTTDVFPRFLLLVLEAQSRLRSVGIMFGKPEEHFRNRVEGYDGFSHISILFKRHNWVGVKAFKEPKLSIMKGICSYFLHKPPWSNAFLIKGVKETELPLATTKRSLASMVQQTKRS